MMRSMAASMVSSGMSSGGFGMSSEMSSDKCFSFEFGDRQISELDLVDLAAMKHLYDDREQMVVGNEIIWHGASAAQIIRGDGIGIAHHPRVHHSHTAFDQHGLVLRYGWISPEGGTGSNCGGL